MTMHYSFAYFKIHFSSWGMHCDVVLQHLYSKKNLLLQHYFKGL